MKNATRAIPVDLLRILGASAIFYFHGGLVTGWPLSQWGEFAVATFIYLASFCAMRYSPPAPGRTRSYWWSRFKAVYPTFAVISIILFAASFLYSPRKTGFHYTGEDLAANLLMVSQYVGRPWMTQPMWFVPFVLQLYLILPFLVRTPVRLRTMLAAFVVSGAACAAVFALLPTHADFANGVCRNWSPIFRLPEVLFGCILARSRSVAGAAAPVAGYIACCALFALSALPYPPALPTLLLPLKGAVVSLVLAAIAAVFLPFIKDKHAGIVGLFGRAAFPFFLLHGPGIGFVSDKFGRNIPAWILYFVLCWAAAIALMLALEKTLRRAKAGGAAG